MTKNFKTPKNALKLMTLSHEHTKTPRTDNLIRGSKNNITWSKNSNTKHKKCFKISQKLNKYKLNSTSVSNKERSKSKNCWEIELPWESSQKARESTEIWEVKRAAATTELSGRSDWVQTQQIQNRTATTHNKEIGQNWKYRKKAREEVSRNYSEEEGRLNWVMKDFGRK